MFIKSRQFSSIQKTFLAASLNKKDAILFLFLVFVGLPVIFNFPSKISKKKFRW